jgi:membrane protease YdiL (CAAX protease family)
MRWTTGVLSREDTILGFDPEPFLSRTPAGRRRATFLAMAGSVLVYFYVGNLLQARSLIPGLLASLWALLPLLGAGSIWLAWSGGSLREILSIRRPPLRALLGAPLLGAGLVAPMLHGVAVWQGMVMPSPEGLFEPLTDPLEKLPLPALLFTLGVSPGANEELVFRGAFLGLLRRTGSARAAVLASSAFFALIHLSIFRFAPTFLIGVLLALVVTGTRSIFPAMLLHATYNGLAVCIERSEWLAAELPKPSGWAASLVALAAGAWMVFGPARQSPSTRRPIPPM